jgi:DNA invertase Pin-like site-specific DNA recombinase
MRVSTRGQNDDTQMAALTEAGCVRVFRDKGVSGKLHKRPELDACLAYLREGDTLVITRLSRAMRSLRHLLDVVSQLQERGINLRVLKQPIDTTTPTGRLLFNIIAAIDEFQRELIVEGTREGLALARSKGHKGGQPRKLSPEQTRQAKRMIEEDGEEVTAVARMFGVSRMTVYRAIDRLEADEAVKQ